jgi:hypothetical protein
MVTHLEGRRAVESQRGRVGIASRKTGDRFNAARPTAGEAGPMQRGRQSVAGSANFRRYRKLPFAGGADEPALGPQVAARRRTCFTSRS